MLAGAATRRRRSRAAWLLGGPRQGPRQGPRGHVAAQPLPAPTPRQQASAQPPPRPLRCAGAMPHRRRWLGRGGWAQHCCRRGRRCGAGVSWRWCAVVVVVGCSATTACAEESALLMAELMWPAQLELRVCAPHPPSPPANSCRQGTHSASQPASQPASHRRRGRLFSGLQPPLPPAAALLAVVVPQGAL